MEESITAYLGLGSNLEDRLKNLEDALDALEDINGITVLKNSSFFETEPQGVRNQPRFINCAAQVEITLSPDFLLERVKEIEKKLGREKTLRWGPRLIDIDILLYNGLVVDEPELKIPHPMLAERIFVLEPLAEIAGDFEHPVLKVSIRELLMNLKQFRSENQMVKGR